MNLSSENEKLKICFVTSSGGHLTHLLLLEEWYKDKNRFWVTFNKEDANSSLINEKIYYCYYPTNRNLKNLLKNAFLALKLLRKEKPNIIVSTGAGVAVPFFYIAKIFKIKTVYIEVFDRIDTPTLTGKLVHPVTDLFITQWDTQTSLYKNSINLGPII